MRIALVSREVSPFYGAGIGAYTTAMARAWSRSHEVHLLTLPHPTLAERAAEVLPNIHIHTLTAPTLALRYNFQKHAMSVLDSLRTLHQTNPFDYIEFPDYGAEGYLAIAAHRTSIQFAGATLAVRLHTPTRECRALNEDLYLDEEGATLEAAEDHAIRNADAVISPSQALLNILRGRFEPPPSARWSVVPYPFDASSLADLGASESAAAATSPTIIYIGRLERRKGVDLLIEAAKPTLGLGARLRFIGADTRTGPHQSSMLDHLRSRIPPDFANSVAFDGPLPRHQLAAAIRSATASGGFCCFPSRWENYPNVCLEAMALGAPVLGSDAGGMSEIIEHESSGLLFRSGDTQDLARNLTRLLEDPALRTRLSAAAPKRIQSACDPRLVVERTVEILTKSSPPTLSTTTPRFATLPPDQLGLTPTPSADWLLLLSPGVQTETRFQTLISAAISREPAVRCIAALAARNNTIHTPAGLDRDLLAIHDCAAFGFLAIHRSLIDSLTASRHLHNGSLWCIAAILAAFGHHCTLVPELLIRNITLPDAKTQALTRAHLAQQLPNLPQTPGRALQLFDSVRRAELHQLNERLAAATAEAAALKTHLASRRYRLADRLNNALKSLRLR